jgi:hypothetical protein
MKKIIILLVVIAVFSACEKVVDKQPLDMISDAQVWDDPALIDANLNNLYNATNIYCPWSYKVHAPLVTLTDEARTCIGWSDALVTFPLGILNPSNCDDDNYLSSWEYNTIRNYNDFLLKLQTGNVSEDFKAKRTAEVRYLRAWTYYNMAIRYGGIPLITEPQTLDDDIYVYRNTEDEIYEFVRTELDEIINVLPESNTGVDLWRVNKYVALALKSRAMLHAASIAKYGQVLLDGVVGVPASKAEFYFQESYNASKAILANPKYSLYKKYSDKVKNYQYLFLEENNSEIIYCKKFVEYDKGHNLDVDWQPILYKATIASIVNPTIEMIDEYEFADGTPGSSINYNQEIHTRTLYKNKEPRFHATILYNKAFWVDDTITTHYFTVQNSLADPRKNTAAFRGKHVNDREAGATQSGFLIKKFLNERRGMVAGDSGQDFIIFRLGEIYLNLAEAAYQLGGADKELEALNALNDIRDRAGVPDRTEINMDYIKHERKVELAFEGFRMWDARRWRDAVTEFSGVFHKMTAYYITSKATFGYLIENCQGTAVRVFKEEHYYNPIAQERIFENPNLIQNPGYN